MSQTLDKPKIEGPDTGTGRWMVVIFNNDHTPQDLVVLALMRATACGRREAEMEMWEAEKFGKAPVHFAAKDECDQAAAVISSIGVKTEVSPEWPD
jgi:hypothetical protein